jgi:hypothetical protein
VTETSTFARPHDEVVGELCARVFRSLPRSDQRSRGQQYVRGLLHAQGRKSVRNIAAAVGQPESEQNLHHFVASSTWTWQPVRRALAQTLLPVVRPKAWVVRPAVIRKVGEHTVGVSRRFVPDLGQVINAQQAVGVWAAAEAVSAPIDWQLHLPGSGLLGDCAVELAGRIRSELPVRPVVLDARDSDLDRLLPGLRATGCPFLVRIFGRHRWRSLDVALAGRGELSGHQLMAALRDQRRPVYGVLLASTPLAGGLTLVATGRPGEEWPGEWWLTDLDASPAELVRLTTLLGRVGTDLAGISDRVGIRDFAGRSYGGWHRHTTLASVAHGAVVLAGVDVL